jgi:hypothetical protein
MSCTYVYLLRGGAPAGSKLLVGSPYPRSSRASERSFQSLTLGQKVSNQFLVFLDSAASGRFRSVRDRAVSQIQFVVSKTLFLANDRRNGTLQSI